MVVVVLWTCGTKLKLQRSLLICLWTVDCGCGYGILLVVICFTVDSRRAIYEFVCGCGFAVGGKDWGLCYILNCKRVKGNDA